jgi:hypothetical protein
MRRWAVVVVGALALSGCTALPEGVDGDLTGGWAALPAATPFRPQAGACHAEMVRDGRLENYKPVPCTGEHLVETVAVAEVTGTDQALATCTGEATAFLGADWRTGWILLRPVLPSSRAWAAGARWVRCDVAETSPVSGDLVSRTGSLRGAVGAAGRLRMTCANPKIEDDRVTAMHPVDCARDHTAEFAGLFLTTRRTPSADDLAAGCEKTIATFAKLPVDGSLSARIGWLGFPPDADAWDLGDRAVRCYLWLNGATMKGSYRNAGPGKLKIQYA